MAKEEIILRADDQASKKLKQVNRNLKSTERQAKKTGQAFVGVGRTADGALGDLAKRAGEGQGGISLMTRAVGQLKTAILGLIGAQAIAGFFRDATRASLEEEEALRRLAFAVDAAGDSFSASKDKIVGFANAQQARTRFDDTTTFASIGRIIRVTGDLEQAMAGAALAQDIASASGKDLNFVNEQVANLLAGEKRALLILRKEFGAFIGDAENTQQALTNLQESFTGAAAEEQSFTKGLKASTNFLGDFSQRIGDGIMPAVQMATRAIAGFAKGWEELGETIAFALAAAQIKVTQTLGVISNLLRGNVAGAAAAFKEGQRALEQVASDFAEGIEAIENRFNSKKEKRDKTAAQLRSKIRKEDKDKEAKALAEKAKAAEAFEVKVRQLEQQRLELSGKTFEARMDQIQQQSNAEIQALNDLAEKGDITNAQLNAAVVKVAETTKLKVNRALEETGRIFNAQKEITDKITEEIEDRFSAAFADLILEGKSFAESFKSFFRDIARIAIQEFIKIELVKRAVATTGPFGLLALGGFGALAESFQHGTKRVPGPKGAARVAVVHGGEEIVPAGGGASGGNRGMLGSTPSIRGAGVNITVNLQVADLNAGERARVIQALTEELRALTDPARDFANQVTVTQSRSVGRAT